MLRQGLDVVCLTVFQADCCIYDEMEDFELAEASFFAFLPQLMVSVWKVGYGLLNKC